MLKKIIYLCLLGCMAFSVSAQKKVLDAEAYKQWRRVEAQQISDNGEWVSYRYCYIDRDMNEGREMITYLRNMVSGKVYELKDVQQLNFFNQGKGLKYVVSHRSENGNPVGKDSIFLLSLGNMKKIYWDKPYGFRESVFSNQVTYSYPIGKNEKGEAMRRLVIWNFGTKDSVVMDSIGHYMLLNNDRDILYERDNGRYKSLRYGVIGGKHEVVYSHPEARLDDFTFDERKGQGTLIACAGVKYRNQPNLLYSFLLSDLSYRLVMNFNAKGLPEEYKAEGRTYPVYGGGRYVFPDIRRTRPLSQGCMTKRDTTFELELWTWDEEVSQKRQLHESGGRQRDLPQYVYRVKSESWLQVAPEGMKLCLPPDHEEYEYVLVSDASPYRGMADWRDELASDWYRVSLESGERELLFKDFRGNPEWSPNGKYALFYERKSKVWYRLELATGQLNDISSGIGYPVYDEEYDRPEPAHAYGVAGWIDGGDKVVLYDRYDMWIVDLVNDTPPISLTEGWGRKNQRILRLVQRQGKLLDLSKDLLLYTKNTENLECGIYKLSSSRKWKKLMEGAFAIRVQQISQDGNACIFLRQSYSEFRDLWWSKMNFTKPVRVTEANPQQKNYHWGEVKLVEWKMFDGTSNRGLLYLPDDYDAQKPYPVIVNFYETHTGDIHIHPVPDWSSAMINVVSYVSDGYVIFMPDVHFKLGDPGESSYNAVVSGTQMLIDRGIADKDHIGIQGHSWSGYQVAYLVTRTNLFKCASPGAAVTNMVSAYTGIREGSGMPRMFMYEETQGRMGKMLWEDVEGYIKNSPILYADKIQTPLLIFHCDTDEAVPYSEGLNLFLAMRRLHKPAWLLNYKGDHHFLYNKAAQQDWTIRLKQFFDYYLRDTAFPRWMKEGIRVDERGIDQKYDLIK